VNLLEARIVLRPRTLAEVLDLATRWCFGVHRVIHARLAAVLLLPSFVACVAAHALLGWSWPSVWMLAAGLALVTQGAFTIASGRLLFERDVSARSVLLDYARQLPSYLVVLVASRVMLVVGVFVLPLAWMRVAFVHEASLLEKQGPVAALRRASRLGARRGGETLLLLGALGLATLAAVCAAELVGHGLVDFVLQLGRLGGDLLDDGGSIHALLGMHIAIPYVAVARFCRYVDERTRSDGWDIQLRFMALAAEHEASRRDAA
jgi:hypothetical protein